MNWYILLLSRHPWVILLASGLLSLLSIICSATLQSIPDFSDPQEGFESRGTEISVRLTTWDNLLDSISHVGPLTTNPIQPVTSASRKRKQERKRDKKKKKGGRRVKNRKRQSREIEEEDVYVADILDGEAETPLERWRRDTSPLLSTDHRIAWLCGNPMADFSRVVYKSKKSESLFTYDAIISMCTLETLQLKNVPQYSELCESKGPVECCPGWSIGGYIALLYNRTSCFAITEGDVAGALRLVQSCAPHYLEGALAPECRGGGARCGGGGVPPLCRQHDAVYTILHYLTDIHFPSTKEPDSLNLTYAISFLPLARSSMMLEYFNNINMDRLCDSRTEIVAMDLGLKDALFNSYLLEDASYLLFSLLMISLLVWAYTCSLTLTLASLSSILASLGLAYFTYTFVLRLTFFPFMNILAAVIALGVGADDTFILTRFWSQKQGEFLASGGSGSGSAKLEMVVGSTLRHALVSMLVTSLTTTAAFLASVVSNITAIKCFSIFSSLTIIWNFVLMSTWVPAWLILHHKILVIKLSTKLPNIPKSLEPFCARMVSISFFLAGWVRSFFEKILPFIIVKPKAVWISLSVVLLILSGLATLHSPGLRLPTSSDLQLFTSSHPFERYDMEFKHKFGFERDMEPENEVNMPLRFVFGTVARDTGSYLDPGDRGVLALDPNFDMSSKEAQSWMFKFCNSLKKQSWYKYTRGDLQLSNCFIITFKEFMYRPCYNDLSKENHRPCCRESAFPFEPAIFNECLLAAVDELYETPSFLWLPGVAGPKFNIETKRVSAVVVEYEAGLHFSYNYEAMDEFYREVETWFQSILKEAPLGLRNGFFVSYLEFYDLQQSLLHGTYTAVGVAMAASLLALCVSTRSLGLSLLAILTVFLIILTTIAVLVLLGWELNILESVIITLAIGLSVDFTLHYGIMYRLAGHGDRDRCVRHSIAIMSSPVSMAALTTLSAGLCLLPTRVLAYIQIGTFILVLMTVSWLLSTFLFPALLSTWGPRPIENTSPWSCSTRSMCCQLEEEEDLEDEVENMKKAFTVSDTMVSAVSSADLQIQPLQRLPHQTPAHCRLPEVSGHSREMMPLGFQSSNYPTEERRKRREENQNQSDRRYDLSRKNEAVRTQGIGETGDVCVSVSVKKRRSQSYSKHLGGRRYVDVSRRKSLDNVLQQQFSDVKNHHSSCEILNVGGDSFKFNDNNGAVSFTANPGAVTKRSVLRGQNQNNSRQELRN